AVARAGGDQGGQERGQERGARAPGLQSHRRRPQRKAQPAGMPSRANSFAAGQKPVMLACTRFSPTKAVSSSHQDETKCPSARLASTISPAKARTARSRFMVTPAEAPGYSGRS